MKKHFKTIIALISVILKLTGKYFEKFALIPAWQNKMCEIEDTHENITALSGQAKFFLGFLLLLCFFIVGVDFGTIKPFVEGLSNNAGGLVGDIILFLGAFIFIAFELLAGILKRHGKKQDNGSLVFLGFVLGLVICALPAYMIYKTYEITPDEDKTIILYNKTIAYMIFSFVIHLLSFLLIEKILDAFQWVGYGVQKGWHNLSNPSKKMKYLRKELLAEFENFDRNMNKMETTEDKIAATATMNNRAWFLRQKLSDGNVMDDYDLSCYNENIDYSPFAFAKNNAGSLNHAETKNDNGKYEFGKNGKYSYTVS
jgi:hypothetical protein